MAFMTLRNSNVDGGSEIQLMGASFIPSYRQINYANPLDGQASPKLPPGNRVSIQPPSLTIAFVINVDDFLLNSYLWNETPSTNGISTEDGMSLTGFMTLGALQKLWRSLKSETYVKIPFGNPDDQKYWRNYNNTSDDICVLIDSIDPIPAQDAEGHHIINVTLTCREVAPDADWS